MVQLENMILRAVEVRHKYDELNDNKNQPRWSGQEYMAGFVGDVGDLSKTIMAKHGLRSMEDVDEKLAHELADCLWSVLVLAHQYQIDIGTEFSRLMDELEERIEQQKTDAG